MTQNECSEAVRSLHSHAVNSSRLAAGPLTTTSQSARGRRLMLMQHRSEQAIPAPATIIARTRSGVIFIGVTAQVG